MPVKKPEIVAETETKAEKQDNMRFYNKVRITPVEAQKSFNNGRFSGTDINPMWRISKLTEIFGPVGFGWWTQNVRYDFVISEQTNEVAVFCELELVVVDPETKEKSNPIYGVGGNTFVAQRSKGPQSSDEAKKMAYTDALSIACKALGFSHDIYYAKDKTKYTEEDGNTEPTPEDFQAITKRIQNGIAKVTSGMTKEQKDEFMEKVVAKHIGSVNYMTCKDMVKLNALLGELLDIAKKSA